MEAPVQERVIRLRFDLDHGSGWYRRQLTRVKFARVPAKLKVDLSAPDRFGHASSSVTGPARAKGNVFHSDLKELPIDGWYVGKDHCYNGKRLAESLVLFEFSSGRAILSVHYFKDFYLLNVEERTRYAVAFIQDQQQQGTA